MVFQLELAPNSFFTVTQLTGTTEALTFQKGSAKIDIHGDAIGLSEVGSRGEIKYIKPTLFSDWQDETTTPYASKAALLSDLQSRLYEAGGTSFVLTDGKGTTANGTAVDLGGSWETNFNITSTTNNAMNITSDNGVDALAGIHLNGTSAFLDVENFDDEFIYSIQVEGSIGSVTMKAANDGTGDESFIVITSTTMTVDDQISSIGLNNAADYSASAVARTLMDKAYVDAGDASDPRLKNIVGVLENTLDFVKITNPLRFDWKDNVHSTLQGSDMGFTTDQFKDMFPELITRDFEVGGEMFDRLAYKKTVAILWKAVQQLAEKVEKTN